MTRDVDHQNDYIVNLFFNRTGKTEVTVDVHTSLRDMVFYHADLVNKTSSRRLNMEYDFKRRPISVTNKTIHFNGEDYSHVIFNTSAWNTIEEFKSFRSMFDNYIKNNLKKKTIKIGGEEVPNIYQCIKDKDDFQRLADYYDARNSIPIDGRSYLKITRNADVSRLKRDICRAFKQGQAGLDEYAELTANEFLRELKECGFADFDIKLVRADIENGGRNEFQPHMTGRTKNVMKIVRQIKARFPKFDPEMILSNYDNEVPLNQAFNNRSDPFLKRTFKL